jgi:hypothetical protein
MERAIRRHKLLTLFKMAAIVVTTQSGPKEWNNQ